MSSKSKNFLLTWLQEQEVQKKLLKEKENNRLAEKYKDSFLITGDIHNYKDSRYSIDKIVAEILKLTPFKHEDFFLLVEFVENRMRQIVYDPIYRRHTKPRKDRGLNHALNRAFQKQKKQNRLKKENHQKEITELTMNITAITFEMELIDTIYKNKIAKTDAAYNDLLNCYMQTILSLEGNSNLELAQKLKENLPKQGPTYKDIAYNMRDRYLNEYTNLPKQRFDKELNIKIKDVSKYSYPTRKDLYPKE